MSKIINEERQKSLSQTELKLLLHYNPDTGIFTRSIATNGRIKVGDIAGSLNSQGYWWIGLKGQMFRAHRLVWLYVHGRFPTAFVDHINNIRHDNRLNNLRECSHAENNLNIGKRCDNSSGIIGVTWHKETNKWRVRAQVDGKDFSLGLYPTKEEAALARKVFVEQNHGDFAYTV